MKPKVYIPIILGLMILASPKYLDGDHVGALADVFVRFGVAWVIWWLFWGRKVKKHA